jgi:hypothetical protein
MYEEILSGGWYVTDKKGGSADDSLECITKKDDFEKLKSYTDCDDAPIKDWNFEEGKHIIMLSY